jgi:hypothetical protein
MIFANEELTSLGLLRLKISTAEDLLRIFELNLAGMGGVKPLFEKDAKEVQKLLRDKRQTWAWYERSSGNIYEDKDPAAARRWVEIAREPKMLHLMVIERLSLMIDAMSDESAIENVRNIAAEATGSLADENIWKFSPFGVRAQEYGPWKSIGKLYIRDDEYGVLAQIALWFKNALEVEALAPILKGD